MHDRLCLSLRVVHCTANNKHAQKEPENYGTGKVIRQHNSPELTRTVKAVRIVEYTAITRA